MVALGDLDDHHVRITPRHRVWFRLIPIANWTMMHHVSWGEKKHMMSVENGTEKKIWARVCHVALLRYGGGKLQKAHTHTISVVLLEITLFQLYRNPHKDVQPEGPPLYQPRCTNHVPTHPWCSSHP